MSKVSLLSAVVRGNYLSRFTCVEDSLEGSGRSLLQAIAQNAIDNKSIVHIFCNEHPIEKFKNSLHNADSNNIHFHDFFTDQLFWIKHCDAENVDKKSESEMSITSTLENISNGSRGPCVIVLESLTSYVLNNGFLKCYQEFSKLLSSGIKELEVLQIVCLVHGDTLPSADLHLPQLAYLATTYITVRASAVANIVYKKPGGKVIKQVEQYTVSTENKIVSQIVKPSEISVLMKHQEVVKTLPDNLTTFKLSLGQQEKEARSQLVLPYIRKEENSGGGFVYYQPDAADDWDEEDPDDDLDI